LKLFSEMASKARQEGISVVSNANTFNAIEQHTLDTNAGTQLS